MAHFTISYTSDAGTTEHDSKTYSEANGDRFIDWLWAAYPQYEVEPDEDGNPIPLPDTPGNRAKAFREWADTVYADLKAKVVNHEKHHAAQDAANAVPGLEPEV